MLSEIRDYVLYLLMSNFVFYSSSNKFCKKSPNGRMTVPSHKEICIQYCDFSLPNILEQKAKIGLSKAV